MQEVAAYSRATGATRLVLAMVAMHVHHEDPDRRIQCTAEVIALECNLSRSQYFEHVRALIETGELVRVSGGGGRGKASVLALADLRALYGEPLQRRRRVAPPAGARPLVNRPAPRTVSAGETVRDPGLETVRQAGLSRARPDGVEEQPGGKTPPAPRKRGERAARALSGSRRRRDLVALQAETTRPPTTAELASWQITGRANLEARLPPATWHGWGQRMRLVGFDVQTGDPRFDVGHDALQRLAAACLADALRDAA
jgi:hypothetical protein